MSSSGGHQQSQSRAIPTRTVPISDSSQLPHDYCTTPGGTLFSTTPGEELYSNQRNEISVPMYEKASVFGLVGELAKPHILTINGSDLTLDQELVLSALE
ncbi:putative Eukaryotic translation initiation factor 4E-binding protein [Naja naja]|nr:putative Eukaryotic translation initiation factor 4E-binding protein [Naja naja]